jgi:Tn3 transposase DDE domain-containing protein
MEKPLVAQMFCQNHKKSKPCSNYKKEKLLQPLQDTLMSVGKQLYESEILRSNNITPWYSVYLYVDGPYLLDVITQQQTKLTLQEVMVDTAGTSDIIFALFWLLGYQLSPRLADIGSTRLWKIDSKTDYGVFNDIVKSKTSLKVITKHWDDVLRITVSLKLGHIRASELIKSLFKNNRPSSLAKAIISIGRIRKTIYSPLFWLKPPAFSRERL